MARKKQFYDADEAVTLLKVSKGTLYSYVSRGLIRSEETAGKTRSRRYLAEDVDGLVERKRQRKNPERVAKAALSWGAPVLESALTSIEDGKLYYRGQDAAKLALERTFEETANLLWSGTFEPSHQAFAEWGSESDDGTLQSKIAELIRIDVLKGGPIKPLEAFQIVLPTIGAKDLSAYALDKPSIIRTAWQILQAMTTLLSRQFAAGRSAPSQSVTSQPAIGESERLSIAQSLQRVWLPNSPDVVAKLNAALILCADHELNVSAFTVRCVASAGSSPYAGVVAGLSALQGHRHGGASERVELLFKEIEAGAEVEDERRRTEWVISNRIKRGEMIPGFGHPLYPDGDPRCAVLLALAHQYDGESPILKRATAIVGLLASHVGVKPNLDFGLVVLCRVLGLPDGAPLAIFALGRTAGWMGHYIEQIETGQLIRPRATYIGQHPEMEGQIEL